MQGADLAAGDCDPSPGNLESPHRPIKVAVYAVGEVTM